MPGSVHVSGPGIVELTLSPPLEFIKEQTGAFRARLLEMSGLWEKFAGVMESTERARFGTAGFGEWPPLAWSTLKEKVRLGFPLDPLIRTGDLERSLTDREQAMRILPQRMTWGTDIPYAKYHQGFRNDAGEPTDPGRPPVRKPLDLRVEDRRRLESAMIQWINEIAAETIGRGL
jgi:phage gpG-like protein